MSSPDIEPDTSWTAAALELRRTCKALAEIVGAGCVGGAGRLELASADKAAQLEAAPTAGLGRALVVVVWLPWRAPNSTLDELEARVKTLALAVERGHMVWFGASDDECAPAVARMVEVSLIEASRNGQLLSADLKGGGSSGWSVDAMAQLSVVQLMSPDRETIPTLVGAGELQRIELWYAMWADMAILSSLREVRLIYSGLEDLSPLAHVPSLDLSHCGRIKALPAMRNDVLRVEECESLTDVSGLAGGRVGYLGLWGLSGVKDVGVIGAMQPPPRTVFLARMPVQDVSMLAGVHRLELIGCRKVDKAATLAALEGKVGTVRWRWE